jgi:hypothetical protein
MRTYGQRQPRTLNLMQAQMSVRTAAAHRSAREKRVALTIAAAVVENALRVTSAWTMGPASAFPVAPAWNVGQMAAMAPAVIAPPAGFATTGLALKVRVSPTAQEKPAAMTVARAIVANATR